MPRFLNLKYILILIPCLMLFISACENEDNNNGGNDNPITVSSDLPADIPGGAPSASLTEAARFAWQEFIALNWPALLDTRDTPDNTQLFGDSSFTGPLVWHTFRHKVEIYPGQGNPPGFVDDEAQDFGYNSVPPVYRFGPQFGDGSGLVEACPEQTPVESPAFINLDEISQIGLASMFAGIAPELSDVNSVPQLVRFLAKANKVYYKYVADKNALEPEGDPLFSHPEDCAATPGITYCAAINNFNAVSQGNGDVTTLPGFVINFNTGTIQVKTGWRPLTEEEKNSGRFYTTTVRYYEANETDAAACYREDEWGLLSLHIEHKTPTAPDYIYATFEQADNILLPDGTRVEDEDGNIINPPAAPDPTTPDLFYMDGEPPTLEIVGESFCNNEQNRIYYAEIPANTGLPSGGNICTNQRNDSIPPPIINVNAEAHTAISDYNEDNGLQDSPWLYYKLINVQPQPFDISDISADDSSNTNRATFYMNNIMVETDYTLQLFSGSLTSPGPPSDLPSNFENFNQSTTFQNVLDFEGNELSQTYNMGGCMGCHGNAQGFGSDFSFILLDGRVMGPEAPNITDPGTSNGFPNVKEIIEERIKERKDE